MINLMASILTALVAIEHIYILWLEMFAWETAGKRTFRGALPHHLFNPTKKMAANQGLYNGFLAAGLIWSYLITDPVWIHNIRLFFLSCVAIAGIYGGIISSRKILVIQAAPAIVSILFVILSKIN